MLMLIARIGEARLAVEARAVEEIHRAVLVAPLPGAPSVVEGTVVVRGAVLPVVDLAARLGLPPRPRLSPDEHLVVLHARGRRVAVRVDDAESLEEVDESAIARGDALVRAARTVAGVVTLADGTVTLHDPAAFLSQAEQEALDRAMARA